MFGFASSNFVTMVFFTWMPTFLYEKFHLSLTEAGFFSVIYLQLASVTSAPITGWLADRLSLKISGGRVLLQVASLLLGIIFIFSIGKAVTVQAVIVAFIGFGICKGGYDAGIFASLFDYIEPKMRGSASGLNRFIGCAGGAFGPVIFGAISSYGTNGSTIHRMSLAFSWSALFFGLAACLLLGAWILGRKQ